MSAEFRLMIRDLRRKGYSVRDIARMWGKTVPQVHEAAGCVTMGECKGNGCRIGR